MWATRDLRVYKPINVLSKSSISGTSSKSDRRALVWKILERIQLCSGCWKSNCWGHGLSDEAVRGGMDCCSFLNPKDLKTSKVICMPCIECYLFDIMVTSLYDVCHSISMLEKFSQSLQNLSFELCVWNVGASG